MTRPQYSCPDCSATVWHSCHPPSYWRGRSMSRDYELRTLRTVELPAGGYPSLEERWHGVFADVAGGYRPPTPEQARAETGTDGRRKPGTGMK